MSGNGKPTNKQGERDDFLWNEWLFSMTYTVFPEKLSLVWRGAGGVVGGEMIRGRDGV
jgi:hypothetical protein